MPRTASRPFRSGAFAFLPVALAACGSTPSGNDAGMDAALSMDASLQESGGNQEASVPGDAGDGGPVRMCTGGSTRQYVVARLAFSRESPMGVSRGFDLDGRISAAGDPETCGKADFTAPDGTRGIDNQIAYLAPVLDTLFNGAVDGLIAMGITQGTMLVGIGIDHVDSTQNDDCVSLSVWTLRRPSELTVGTDGQLDPNQTFDVDSAQRIARGTGVIRDGVLLSDPMDVDVRVRILDANFGLAMKAGRVRARFDANGDISGELGGGLLLDDVVQTVRSLNNVPQSALSTVANVLQGLADLDRRNNRCNQFSAAVTYAGRPAFVNE